jgi:hypothetical protein
MGGNGGTSFVERPTLAAIPLDEAIILRRSTSVIRTRRNRAEANARKMYSMNFEVSEVGIFCSQGSLLRSGRVAYCAARSV